MTRLSNKIAKDSMKNGNYSLIEIYKIVFNNDKLSWGCHVIDSKNKDLNIEIENNKCRFVC